MGAVTNVCNCSLFYLSLIFLISGQWNHRLSIDKQQIGHPDNYCMYSKNIVRKYEIIRYVVHNPNASSRCVHNR